MDVQGSAAPVRDGRAEDGIFRGRPQAAVSSTVGLLAIRSGAANDFDDLAIPLASSALRRTPTGSWQHSGNVLHRGDWIFGNLTVTINGDSKQRT